MWRAHRYIHPSIAYGARRTDWVVSPGGEEAADGAGASGLAAETELLVGVLEVPLDRPDTERELGGDGGVVVPLGGEGEHLDLPPGEDLAEVAPPGQRRVGGLVLRQEVRHLAQEHRPGELVL